MSRCSLLKKSVHTVAKAMLADRVADRFIGHDVNLQRLQASQRIQMLRALKTLERKLEEKIRTHTRGEETFTLRRNRALLREATQVIGTAYAGITEQHRALLTDMGTYELRAVAQVVNRQVGVSLMSVGVPEDVITSMLKDNTIFGAPLDSYWEQQSVTVRNKFATEMRAGIFAGETNDQLIQRVRGTRAGNFKDGMMRSARHGAEAVVRTAAQSVLNDARMELYRANADVIDGVQALTVLDDRTTDICIARSGFAWDLDGNPFPGTDTDEDFPGPPPWHPNCRTTLIPIVKSIGDLAKDTTLDAKVEREIEKIPTATQASMDGAVSGDLTYEQWLETKSETFQKEVLGPGRYELWSEGKISLRDLIDQRGNPLTLTQLRAIES